MSCDWLSWMRQRILLFCCRAAWHQPSWRSYPDTECRIGSWPVNQDRRQPVSKQQRTHHCPTAKKHVTWCKWCNMHQHAVQKMNCLEPRLWTPSGASSEIGQPQAARHWANTLSLEVKLWSSMHLPESLDYMEAPNEMSKLDCPMFHC